MRKWCHRGLVATVCLGLFGCVEQTDPLKVAETLAQVRTGRPVLTCRDPCLAEWRRVQPQAAQLDTTARWQDLALLLTHTGYQDDLSLYYLGRAAEGLAAREAAAGYYRQSTQISGSAGSCQSLSRLCGGVALPRAAAVRLAAIERDLSRPRPRRTEPAAPEPAAPEAGPVELTPPPPVAEAPPRPPARPSGPPASEYIEPPPAPR